MLAHKILALYLSGSLIILIIAIIFLIRELREYGYVDMEFQDILLFIISISGSILTIIVAAYVLYASYRSERLEKRSFTNNRL